MSYALPGGQGSYSTGITRGPSITPEQMQASLGMFGSLGSARPSGPYAPAMRQQVTPAQQSAVNQSLQALQGQQGAYGATNFRNQVNPAESQLAYDQASADSGLGRGYQNFLGDLYSGGLSRQSAMNTALLNNAVRQQGLQYGLLGSLFGGLTSGLGSVLGSVGQGLGNGLNMGNPLQGLPNVNTGIAPVSDPTSGLLNGLV